MKLFFSFVFALLAFTACTKPEKEVYIFTSHREPALDGLHYLYSYDGYHWDSIAGSWLKPEIGNKTPYYNYFTKQTEEQKYAPKLSAAVYLSTGMAEDQATMNCSFSSS